jgi:hypothetical protein
VLAVFLVLFFLSANGHIFNEHDDLHAYLVYPYKMLQTGSIDPEQFSERRLGAYGGSSFLQAIMIGVYNLHQPFLMEIGLSWLLIVAIILGYYAGNRRSRIILIIIVLFCHVIEIPSVNSSSLLSGVALLLTLFASYAFMQKENPQPRVIFLSLVSAGICSLKGTFIPACGLILFLMVMFAQEQELAFQQRVKEIFIIFVIGLIMLLPWVVVMYKYSGTLLYPLLGNGLHGSSYSNFPPNSFIVNFKFIYLGRHLLVNYPFMLSVVLLMLSLFKRGQRSFQFRMDLCVFWGLWPYLYFLHLAAGGIHRYAFPFVYAVIIFQLINFFNGQYPVLERALVLKRSSVNLVLILLSFISIYTTFGVKTWGQEWENITHPKSAWHIPYQIQLQKAQKAIPQGVPVLARVSKPYLLNFKRNQIFAVDWPGGAGPPPGLPCFGTAGELVRFLNLQKIRYILYSHGDESGYSYKKFAYRLNYPDVAYLGRAKKLTEYSFSFQDRLVELKNQYENLYLDEVFVAIDISKPKKSPTGMDN